MIKRKRFMWILIIILLCLVSAAFFCTRPPYRTPAEGAEITLTTGDTVLHGKLNDTVAAKAFAAQLPKTYTVSVSSMDMCGGAAELPSDSSENQTGWNIGDIDYGGGWFMIFQRINLNIPFMKMPVIGRIDEEDIPVLQELSGSVTFTVELADPVTDDTSNADKIDSRQDASAEKPEETEVNATKLIIGNTELTADLADNSSAQALVEILQQGDLTIEMRDYGSMEKVGMIGQSLPTNDKSITTEAGDLILYQGNAFVIYYAPNSWNFTRLGKIRDVTATELKNILGSGAVSVTLSID